MSGQVNLISVPVAVFENQGGSTLERGNGACAIVGQSGMPPRYKLVCFNDQRQTLCTATLTGSNEHSLQFALQTAEYACFRSDEGSQFSIMFLQSNDVDLFVAQLACAFYGASAQPSHSTVIADLAHVSRRDKEPGNEVLELGRRAKVRYSSFIITRGATTADLPRLASDKPAETTADGNYTLEAVQSAYSLPADAKGFESSVVGMVTDTTRLIVVPQAMPRTSGAAASATLVFVVHLKRVIADPTLDIPGAIAASRAVATVTGATDRARNALVLSPASNNQAGGGDDGPPRPRFNDPHAPGAGIPAEHMLLVQKVAAQLNTTLSSLRDLHDKVDGFNGEWKQTISRPKPSVLPNSALEQNLRNLINENERARDELTRREELIQAIDERNRDLQRRVDKAAQLAQTLMDEKKKAVSQSSDMRLEMDRQIMRLTEQITLASNERDDVQRHLQTVKKLLDMSDEQLRDTKGRFDVIQVQVRGTTDKLDAFEEQLGEERTRRKAFEAKVAAMQEEIRKASAEAHLKAAELDDVNRKSDADRIYHAQLMEEERHRRSVDTAQLRSEIVTELKLREEKAQADRARTASDNFQRGRDEGMEVGRRNARIDMEHRMQELQLEAQRCRTELDAYKTQLRDTQDDALAENRRLEAAVAALKRSTEDATKQKARNEFSIHALRLRVKHAEDALLLGLAGFVNKLSRPIDPTDLLNVLDDIHNGRRVTVAFEDHHRQQEEESTLRARESAMLEEATAVCNDVLAATYKDWVEPCAAAYAELNTDIARLWYERDMRDVDEVIAGEASCRSGIDAEYDSGYTDICVRWRREIAERDEIVREESSARPVIPAEYDQFAAWLSALLVEQAAARQNVSIGCDVDFDSIVTEEGEAFTAMRQAFERVVFEKLIAEQEAVMGEEDQARIALADVENREFDNVRATAAMEQSTIRDMLAEREKAMRAARSALDGEESQGRVVLELEEENGFDQIAEEFKSTMPKPPTPPPPPRDPTPPPPPRDPTPPPPPRDPTPPPPPAPVVPAAPSTVKQPAQQQQQPPPPMPAATAPAKAAVAPAGTAPKAAAPKAASNKAASPNAKPASKTVIARVTLTDSDVETPRGAVPPAAKPAAKRSALADSDDDDQRPGPSKASPSKSLAAHKKISNPLGDTGESAAIASDSDSDKEGGIKVTRGKAPAAKPAAKSSAAAGLFDTDSDTDAPKPAPKAAGKIVAKSAAPMFDSDSETHVTPRPKPAAKPAPKAKRAVVVPEDSD